MTSKVRSPSRPQAPIVLSNGREGRTIAKWASMRDVFGSEPLELHAHLARAVVLYEDLYLELEEAGNPDGKDMRRVYFVRRSFGTLLEFAECLVLLNGLGEFQQHIVGPTFDKDTRGRWNTALDWFRQHKQQIQEVRNDFGGHFSLGAARFAVATADDEKFPLEVYVSLHEPVAGPRLKFAVAIATSALVKRHGTQKKDDYAIGLFTLAQEGYRHAVVCVHLLVGHYLARRFGF